MAIRSRRKAREAALRALYEIELAGTPAADAVEAASSELELSDDQRAFAHRVVSGFGQQQADIDNRLAKLIREFDFDRVAAVDRNVLRVAAYELLFEPAIPPAVTINEAVEIAKRYSTAESGRFVNGVLARLLRESPKAEWDPDKAPPEETEWDDPPEEVKVELVEADSAEAVAGKKFGSWTVRTDDGNNS